MLLVPVILEKEKKIQAWFVDIHFYNILLKNWYHFTCIVLNIIVTAFDMGRSYRKIRFVKRPENVWKRSWKCLKMYFQNCAGLACYDATVLSRHRPYQTYSRWLDFSETLLNNYPPVIKYSTSSVNLFFLRSTHHERGFDTFTPLACIWKFWRSMYSKTTVITVVSQYSPWSGWVPQRLLLRKGTAVKLLPGAKQDVERRDTLHFKKGQLVRNAPCTGETQALQMFEKQIVFCWHNWHKLNGKD